MKIAILTPMPPQRTGIANYAYDLVQGLSSIKNLDITVVTNKDEVNFDDFEIIIYQLGNNSEFHAYMYKVLKKYGGIIHLHDIVLHQVLADALDYKNNPHEYFNIISKLYGLKTLSYIKQLLGENIEPWKTSLAGLLPCFEAFVEYADACIVHSDYTQNKIEYKFPSLPIYKINQLYNISSDTKQSTEFLTLGVFGGVEVNRKVDVIIESLANSINSNQHKKVKLIIVGAITQRCEYILELPKKLGIDSYVEFYNHVDDNKFLELFNSIDLLIALRDPTVGETSAVVMQALQLNKPVIVSDVGWYSELPSFVDKLSNNNLKDELTQTLRNYLENSNTLDEKRILLKKYSKENFDFNNYINEYFNIIQLQTARNSNKLLTKRVVSYIKEFDLDSDKNNIKRISNKIRGFYVFQ